MKKVIIVGAIALTLVLGCSKPGSNPVGSSEIWWNSPDTDARWLDLPSYCSTRIPATQESADSICHNRGYFRSTGYEQENCYVGGQKQVVLSRVACSID